ncbi:SHOCT domain-containing protein [Lactiplantibacillus plantarum]|uniref:SHOCT domain-containing protein n=1 Tax=Lactiplantibacillus plantarum TaxID=1590 RepID=UPI0013DEEAF1|nr:SHOCT domain-containing protein [Lactiplantibacillus plantarum]MBP5842757.1 SHOCT domain-containing protein [Lactiplantibacillus plantarum]MDI5785715.1 SHOCT domain-containing protein [Lactiplantibacillus plantarum]NGM27418.1 SHOCT domain-containing protein [Lactiplantibacillus plantarum]
MKTIAFSDLTSYKTIESPTTINKNHGLSRSIVGGLVAGPTGAVLGAFSGNKSYDAVSKMAVVLYFNNNYSKQLNYISTETKIDSMYYRDEQEKMQRFCVRLDKILVENENNEPTTLSTPTNSADELRKLKSLLDDGILTEEEFAAKKKQILGI